MTTTTTRPNAPTFSELLVDAINKPGSIMQAYSAFHPYSIGNQLLALFQCYVRGLPTGPINTLPGWKNLGRSVKKGEKALMLCMPITVKRRDSANTDEGEIESHECFTTGFVYRSRWFILAQTDGDEIELPSLPVWNATQALENLDITRIPFTNLDGNCQGNASKRQIAINPVAQLPIKTLLHETAHVVLGHSLETALDGDKRTPKHVREVEAESVALLCCEALGLEGAAFCRGYIQSWANGEPISEKSAKRILGAADKILKAGATKKQPTI